MNIIMTKFDEFMRPIIAPLHAAVYDVVPDLKRPGEKVTMIFRRKLKGEHDALETMQAAKREHPGYSWKHVEMCPWVMNRGGIGKDEAPYIAFVFEKKNAGWHLTGAGLDTFAAQNKVGGSATDIPPEAIKEMSKIAQDVENLTKGL